MSLLTFDSVSYKYAGSNTPEVLQNVNISFEKGVFYSIIGPSGSGKTTALSLAGGLDIPTGGAVRFEGRDIREIGYTEYRRRHVALVFQSYNLIPYLNAEENVCLSMEIGGTYPHERKERARQLLASVGLNEADIHRPVPRLSGGQQQRVAVARALAGDAPVILADEPTGNLDSESATEIVAMLRSLAHEAGRCVVVVSHSAEVAKASDVVLRFHHHTLEPLERKAPGRGNGPAGGEAP
jgi:putative ABC transport system ATP-binding protein